MKKVLFIFLIFCFSLNIISCSSSSDEDDIEEILTPDTTAATLAEVTFVTTPTNDSTPNYTFSSFPQYQNYNPTGRFRRTQYIPSIG